MIISRTIVLTKEINKILGNVTIQQIKNIFWVEFFCKLFCTLKYARFGITNKQNFQ